MHEGAATPILSPLHQAAKLRHRICHGRCGTSPCEAAPRPRHYARIGIGPVAECSLQKRSALSLVRGVQGLVTTCRMPFVAGRLQRALSDTASPCRSSAAGLIPAHRGIESLQVRGNDTDRPAQVTAAQSFHTIRSRQGLTQGLCRLLWSHKPEAPSAKSIALAHAPSIRHLVTVHPASCC